MNFLLIVIIITLFIIKIKILRKELKENKKKLWPIYFPSLFAEVLSLIGIYNIQFEFAESTFNGYAILYIISIICIIENLVLLIVGILFYIKQKKSIKKKKNKTKNYTLIKIVLSYTVTCICMLSAACIPIIHRTEIEKYVESYAIKYMETKYGDGNFRTINITKSYSGGLWSPEKQNVYNVKMKTSYTDEIVNVSIYGTTPEEIKISQDSLILTCYKIDGEYDNATNLQKYLASEKSKIVENEYKKQFNIDINLKCNYKISNDYGHLPTMDELVNLCQINMNNINITINDYIESKDELDYLKRLAKYSINYFNNEETVKINYTLNNKTGYIEIINNIVIIKIDGKTIIFTKDKI